MKWIVGEKLIPVDAIRDGSQKLLPSKGVDEVFGRRANQWSRLVHRVANTTGRQTFFPYTGLGVLHAEVVVVGRSAPRPAPESTESRLAQGALLLRPTATRSANCFARHANVIVGRSRRLMERPMRLHAEVVDRVTAEVGIHNRLPRAIATVPSPTGGSGRSGPRRACRCRVQECQLSACILTERLRRSQSVETLRMQTREVSISHHRHAGAPLHVADLHDLYRLGKFGTPCVNGGRCLHARPERELRSRPRGPTARRHPKRGNHARRPDHAGDPGIRGPAPHSETGSGGRCLVGSG